MPHTLASRILKAVNLLIALLVAAVLASLYWYVWRPLPQRSGTIAAPVTAPVTVMFDTLGVPHIRGSSQEDALIAQGYVTAQDRLWQMDSLRRLASGSLSEIVGAKALELDREALQLRLRRIAEQGYVRLNPQDRAALAAYTLGVNQFISTHLGNLPVEFTLLGYQPRPWSGVDSLLICLHMFRDLTTTWKNDVIKQAMLAEGDPQKVNFLFAARAGDEPPPGSNSWAVAGSHTASGKPILSSDMHLEYSLPGIWYMTHLQAPGMDVSGVSLPGVPGVVVGHNQHIAWGITNLQFDVQDLYREKFEDSSGRYVFHGQVEQAQQEREIIRVKGQRPTEYASWITRHGPMIVANGADRITLRWTAADAGALQYPMLDIDRAENWQQFTTALSRWTGPGSNFVYADVDGNIGYHAAGWLPKRHGFNGDLPLDGSSGDFEWDGYIPFDQLPSAFNPPGGIIASANQNPFPADYPYPVNGNFAPPHRVLQIRKLLSARNGWRAQDMLAVQTDIFSSFSKFLATQVVAAYDKRQAKNPSLDPAVALLRTWDGRMDKDQAAPFLITLVYQHLRYSVAESASPAKAQLYEYNMGPSVVEKLFRDRPEGWFADYDSTLLRAFLDAVDEGKRMQGGNLSRWKYGAYLRVEIDHPIVHAAMQRIPLVGGLLDVFEIGPVPMSGSTTTIKQSTRVLSPSMRMNADLGDWDKSLLNIQIGQSGQPLSTHYKDEWDDYYNGRSYPMQYKNVQAKHTLQFQPSAN